MRIGECLRDIRRIGCRRSGCGERPVWAPSGNVRLLGFGLFAECHRSHRHFRKGSIRHGALSEHRACHVWRNHHPSFLTVGLGHLGCAHCDRAEGRRRTSRGGDSEGSRHVGGLQWPGRDDVRSDTGHRSVPGYQSVAGWPEPEYRRDYPGDRRYRPGHQRPESGSRQRVARKPGLDRVKHRRDE